MPNWPHQQTEIDEHWSKPAWGLWWEPRVGKTRAIIGQMLKLREWQHLHDRKFGAVVIVPSNAGHVWMNEIEECAPGGELVAHALYSGTLVGRRRHITETAHDNQVLIVNAEALYELVLEIRAWKPEMVVADESHMFKSASSRRSSALKQLASAPWRRALSGTPDPKSYRDYYAVFRWLSPGLLSQNLAEFDARYCNIHPHYRHKIIGYRNLDELQTKIFSISSRLRVADARGMPDVREVVRKIPLPHKTRIIYDQMVKDSIADLGDLGMMQASHVLAKQTRLAQLTAGFVNNPPGFTEPVTWIHDAKIDAVVGELSEIVEAGMRAVVWFRYTAEGVRLHEAITLAYPHIGAPVMDGNTPLAARRTYMQQLNCGAKEAQVLIVQEQLSLGTDMSGAEFCMFFSMSFDYANHFQARQRIYSPTGKKCFIYFVVDKSFDQHILKTLRRKKNVSTQMLDARTFQRIAYGEES